MIKVLGKPSEDNLSFITNEHALKFIKDLPQTDKRMPTEGIIYDNPLALDLINKCLEFDPKERLTIEEALAHPYFNGLHDTTDEPSFTKKLEFNFENNNNLTLNELKLMIIEEINEVNKDNKETDIIDVDLIKKGLPAD